MKFTILSVFAIAVSAQNTTDATTDPKQGLCTSNQNTCKLACGGATPTVNTCDPSNMSWDCQCPSGANQTIIDAAFPVPFADCQNQYQQCYAQCNTQGMNSQSDQTKCFNDCQSKNQCGGPNAPAAVGKKTRSQGQQQSSAVMMSALSSSMVGVIVLSLL